jgi:hypothetical protein
VPFAVCEEKGAESVNAGVYGLAFILRGREGFLAGVADVALGELFQAYAGSQPYRYGGSERA